MTRYIKLICVRFLLSLSFYLCLFTPAHAFLGFGDIVSDPALLLEVMLQYITQVGQYYTQAQQYSNQIQQVQNDYQNLQNLNFKTNLSGLNEMKLVMNAATGLSNDFATVQTQFQQQYPDFNSYKTQDGANYAQQTIRWNKLNQQNSLDILKTEAKLQDLITQDQTTLSYLSDRSDTASGAKDLLQVMNQLMVMQTKQLMQLEQLMSQTAKADASYLAERTSRDAAETFRYQQQIDTWDTSNTAVVDPSSDILH